MSKDKKVEIVAKQNIVTMEDNSVENFGTRANLKSNMDLETKIITLKVVSGKIINWAVPDSDGLNEFQLKVYMYGLLEKLKTSLAGIPKENLAKAITLGTTAIDKGVFVIRSLGGAEAALIPIMIAFAKAKSQSQAEFIHLGDTDKPEVIAEILALWESKTPVEKRKLRRDPRVAYQLALLEKDNTPEAEL